MQAVCDTNDVPSKRLENDDSELEKSDILSCDIYFRYFHSIEKCVTYFKSHINMFFIN